MTFWFERIVYLKRQKVLCFRVFELVIKSRILRVMANLLFIQYILNSVSIAYIHIIREVVNSSERWLFPTSPNQSLSVWIEHWLVHWSMYLCLNQYTSAASNTSLNGCLMCSIHIHIHIVYAHDASTWC